MTDLLDEISMLAPRHASIPFWSWNDRLEEGELRRQIRNMNDIGMRGFFMHARGGLETGYFSDEWFSMIRACVKEAKALGMEAWVYDENGWPSGFAGGELLKDPRNHAAYLVCEDSGDFPTDETVLAVYRKEGSSYRRVLSPVPGTRTYTVVRRARDFSYVDVMNPRVADQFLSLVHERYEKEIGRPDFGTVMPGFFTDEPQYYRYGTPWSDTFPEAFSKAYGYDVRDGLVAMFRDYPGAEEFRYDYHLLCHRSYLDGFAKRVYDWCEAHGVSLTGHCIEEWGLGGQMMCCGGVMPFYLYQQMPGIDYLGRGIKDANGSRQLGSVCAQTGKRVALSEMFACCGWDVTPRELKRIAESQFAGGVNLICEHLYPYSERGQRKRDFPNHYSEHTAWQKHYAIFETYMSRLGAALSLGEEAVDTLVLQPIRTAYLHYKHTIHSVGIGVQTDPASGISDLEARYGRFIDRLTRHQIPFHFGDETILSLYGSVEGNRLRVGNCLYDKVVLPYCETLDASTVALLRRYREAGGRLMIVGNPPERVDGRRAELSFLRPNLTFTELSAKAGIRVEKGGARLPFRSMIRRLPSGDRLFFFANTTDGTYRDAHLILPDCRGVEEIDLLTMERRPVRAKREPDGSLSVLYSFGDSASCLLAEADAQPLPFKRSPSPKVLTPADLSFRLATQPENALPLDRAELSYDGKNFTEERPIERIRDNLLRERYGGELFLRFTFRAETVPERLLLAAEPIRGMRVSVNDREIAFTDDYRFDRSFHVSDIRAFTVPGENRILLRFPYYQKEEVFRVLYGGGSESLRNCLAFDTEIEPLCLFGSFGVVSSSGWRREGSTLTTEGPFLLTVPAASPDVTDPVSSGYPFFAGEMTLETSFVHHAGSPTLLRLGGRFATVTATLNGQALGTRLFDDTLDLSPALCKGENRLTLTLCFSNRNFLGPHHCVETEPIFVTPRILSFEKAWDGGNCPNDRTRYAFVRFGIGFAPNQAPAPDPESVRPEKKG